MKILAKINRKFPKHNTKHYDYLTPFYYKTYLKNVSKDEARLIVTALLNRTDIKSDQKHRNAVLNALILKNLTN